MVSRSELINRMLSEQIDDPPYFKNNRMWTSLADFVKVSPGLAVNGRGCKRPARIVKLMGMAFYSQRGHTVFHFFFWMVDIVPH